MIGILQAKASAELPKRIHFDLAGLTTSELHFVQCTKCWCSSIAWLLSELLNKGQAIVKSSANLTTQFESFKQLKVAATMQRK